MLHIFYIAKYSFFNKKLQNDHSDYKRLLLFRRIAITQFSPTYARRAFPCMDEPYLKAEFQLRIGHHKDQQATSNTPVESIRMELVTILPNFC